MKALQENRTIQSLQRRCEEVTNVELSSDCCCRAPRFAYATNIWAGLAPRAEPQPHVLATLALYCKVSTISFPGQKGGCGEGTNILPSYLIPIWARQDSYSAAGPIIDLPVFNLVVPKWSGANWPN